MKLVTDLPEQRAADLRQQGQGLRRLRSDAGLTQTEAAAKLGMSAETYRLYERGVTVLRYDQFRTFAAVYGVSRSALAHALGLFEDAWRDEFRDEFTERGMPPDAIEGYVRAFIDFDEPARTASIVQLRETWPLSDLNMRRA